MKRWLWLPFCLSLFLGMSFVLAQDSAAKKASKEARPTIKHDAVGARVVVSSTHKGAGDEGNPDTLVDGKLFTRWSSDYKPPQHVEVHLSKPGKIREIRIHWEQACAKRYFVSTSADGKTWKPAHLYLNETAKAENRRDIVSLNNVPAQAIRLDLISCVNTNWGFSIYEVEVVFAD